MKGMFDEVRFDFRMPDGYEPGNRYYQTTDLGCDCHQYVIESGRLVRTSDIDGSPAGRDVKFSGVLNIYVSEPIPGTVRGVWREYHLEFIDGTLNVIHCGGMPPAPIPWTAEMDALLGTDTDSQIASGLGVTGTAVAKRRAELGITGFVHSSTTWTPAMDALLGKDTIQAVAKELEVAPSRVCKRMKELKVPAFMPIEKRTFQWTAERDQTLWDGATKPIAELAQMLGVGPGTIAARKVKNGVPSASEIRWFENVDLALVCFETYVDGDNISKIAKAQKLSRSQAMDLVMRMMRQVWCLLPDRILVAVQASSSLEELRKHPAESKRCARQICADTIEKRTAFARRLSAIL